MTPAGVARPPLAVVTVLLLAMPLMTRAQPAGKVPRMGVLANGSAATSPPVDSFRQGLRDFGWVEGQNIALDIRWAEGRFERLPELDRHGAAVASSGSSDRIGPSKRESGSRASGSVTAAQGAW